MGSSAQRGRDGPRSLSFTELVTLFVCAMHKEKASTLLDCFADRPKARAHAFAEQVRQWSSSIRQARLSREFGPRPDELQRLQQMIIDAPPLLRSAVAEQLSVSQRSTFPHLTPSGAVSPAMRALARRLVREAD